MATEPTPKPLFAMSAERAEEIRKAIRSARGWCQVGLQFTKEEEREITAFWARLPSGRSFYDAVTGMARGEHLKLRDSE